MAKPITFAAFTGVNVCAQNEGTGGAEQCMVYINHMPNVTIETDHTPTELVLNHSQYGLNIKTVISLKVKDANSLYQFDVKLESIDMESLKNLVGPITLSLKSFENLNIIKVDGEKICRNAACDEWLSPFIYFGPAWTQEENQKH